MSKFQIGDKVEVVLAHGHTTPPFDVEVGTRAIVTRNPPTYDQVTVAWNDETTATWHEDWFKLQEDSVPAHPFVDFSGTSRATAREYAEAANSRVLTAENQATLKAASLGLQVDVYDLNDAVVEAMSSASTRLGQSMARRGLTKKIRYLGHITSAVLRNHADGLPVYVEGDRSRAVEASKVALKDAADEVEALTARLKEVEDLLNSALAEGADFLFERDEARTRANDLGAAVLRQGKVIEYALDQSSALIEERIRGYLDGVG